MKYHETIIEAVGNTPLVKLNKVTQGVRPLILAKVESLNPGGSVKDRIGIYMIEQAEKKGLLKKGGTIVEPTSGNTGVGLAICAAIKGYKTVFVMPDKVSREKQDLLRAYGAQVYVTPTEVPADSPESYYSVSRRLAFEIKGAVFLNQYANPMNPYAHEVTTGPEIWKQTEGKVTHFVAGMGTGGTLSGVARYLKSKNKKVKIIGADPEGSIYSNPKDIHQYKVEGVGEDFYPETMDLGLIDEIVTLGDREALMMTRRLAREEGLLVGGSSGLAVCAALHISADLGKDGVVVVLLPDTGRGYLSKIYSDEWMKRNNFI